MRLLPSPAPTAAAKTEFRIHLSPQAALPAPPPSARCHVDNCPWWPYSNSREFKANTALVLVFLFCTLICGLACNSAIRCLCARRCRRIRTPDNQKADLGGATAEQESEIPAVIYSEGMNLAGEDAAECAICLSEFAIGERIRVLEKCGHGFHVECIDRWLASRSSCPTCRAQSE